jgi:hypothetical protein
MFLILALGRLRQKDCKFEASVDCIGHRMDFQASLGFIGRPCLTKKKKEVRTCYKFKLGRHYVK